MKIITELFIVAVSLALSILCVAITLLFVFRFPHFSLTLFLAWLALGVYFTGRIDGKKRV